MKKSILIIIYIIFCFCCFLSNANALNENAKNEYVNKNNVVISFDDYNKLTKVFLKSTIENMKKETVMYYLDNYNKIAKQNKYSIVTDIYDKRGYYLKSFIKENATLDEVLSIENNKNLRVSSNGELFNSDNQCDATSLASDSNSWEYSTSSKMVSITYDNIGYDRDYYEVIIEAKWFSLPKIRKYDVLAIRWDTSKPLSNVVDCTGSQYNGSTFADYSLDDTNMKRNTYGIGESMNLFNSADQLEMFMICDFTNDIGTVYGTYQHARNSNANTLAISKSYSFSPNGLGGVLYYSNSTYRNYYDGMLGVYDTLYSNNGITP